MSVCADNNRSTKKHNKKTSRYSLRLVFIISQYYVNQTLDSTAIAEQNLDHCAHSKCQLFRFEEIGEPVKKSRSLGHHYLCSAAATVVANFETILTKPTGQKSKPCESPWPSMGWDFEQSSA
jgi:hypothetical protein